MKTEAYTVGQLVSLHGEDSYIEKIEHTRVENQPVLSGQVRITNWFEAALEDGRTFVFNESQLLDS